MSLTIKSDSIEYEGVNYPFTQPFGFSTWAVECKQAFASGVIHVISGANNPVPTSAPQPDREVSL